MIDVFLNMTSKGTGGMFGKTKGWVSGIIKNLGKMCNKGKKSGIFIWHDELGLQRSGWDIKFFMS